jgi:hypothetical protein
MHEPSLAPTQSSHESSVFGTTRIVAFSAALTVLMVLTALVAIILVGGFRLPAPPTAQPPLAAQVEPTAAPQLQSVPASDLRVYRREKETQLQEYRWIDQSSGRVQIPIERAMQLTVERSAPRSVPPRPAKVNP